ncbi:MAG: mannose-6-phosphate isomerase [Oscillospiraceae bacterium]|nr:mannose-6-phosphate isomerase [Oscillospiraceae bacterium]
MDNNIVKLMPACKDYLWGGSKLKTAYGKDFAGDILAEAWELSCHPEGPGIIAGGPDAGMTLPDYIAKHGRGILGRNCARFEDFPVLVKLIDARQDLSVQVHPDDAYALRHENSYGKTEMWYVADCLPGASIYYGFAGEVSRKQVEDAIGNGSLQSLLRRVPVKRGDAFFIEAGTVHAIGAGIIIAEIQQNSNLTYRVYDYGRKDSGGSPRKLHIEKALEVMTFAPSEISRDFGGHIAACDYFAADKLSVTGGHECFADEKSFHHLLVLEGGGEIVSGGQRLSFRKGDSLFVRACTGSYQIAGDCEMLLTTIPNL